MSQQHSPGIDKSGDSADHREQPPTPAAPKPSGQRRLASLFGGVVIVFMIAIVALPLFFTSFSDELSRWRLAAAWEQRLNNGLEAAIGSLDTALERNPDHLELYLQRAAWYDQLGDYKAALRDYNKVNELADNDPRMLLGRAMTYHRMGNKAELIRDLELLLEASRGADRANALNTLAYFRALNDIDLRKALSDIDKSIDLIGPSPALLDTRGFIHYKLGEFEAARSDLESAADAFERYFASEFRPLESEIEGTVDPRVYKLQLHVTKEALAAVVYHRGLIYEKLGETDRAEADFDQVRELGFEPNEKLF